MAVPPARLVVVVAEVAVPTVIVAGSVHCGADPDDVMMRDAAPMASFDKAVPEA